MMERCHLPKSALIAALCIAAVALTYAPALASCGGDPPPPPPPPTSVTVSNIRPCVNLDGGNLLVGGTIQFDVTATGDVTLVYGLGRPPSSGEVVYADPTDGIAGSSGTFTYTGYLGSSHWPPRLYVTGQGPHTYDTPPEGPQHPITGQASGPGGTIYSSTNVIYDNTRPSAALSLEPSAPATEGDHVIRGVVTFRGEARDMCAKGPPSDPSVVPSGHFKQYRIEYCPRTPGASTPPASGWILVHSSTTPKDPGSVLGTWATSSVADGPYWLRLVVTDRLVDAQGGTAQARQALIEAHTNVVYKKVWVENQYPAFTFAVKYDGEYRTGGQVCNLINPVLVVECGHVAESAIQISNVWLRYGEDAGHAGQLLGPVERTTDYTTEQLADGAYRRVYSIAEGGCGGTYGLLSCGYHNGPWTLSTNGQTLHYVWFDHAGGLLPAPVTVEHRNLVITNAHTSGNDDWFIYNRAQTPTVTIGYSVSKLTEEIVNAHVTIYDSGQNVICTLAASHGSNGTFEVVWDGRNADGFLAEPGIYLFDVTATSTIVGDGDQYRSTSMAITNTFATPCGYSEATRELQFEVGYTLTNSLGRDGLAATLSAFNWDMEITDCQSLDPSLGAHAAATEVDIDDDADGGTLTLLVSALDNDATYHKGHRSRLALGRNSTYLIKRYEVILDPGHGGTDPGGIALDGSHEKEYTLAVGLATRDLLQHHWRNHILGYGSDAYHIFAVYMTRDSGVSLPRDTRISTLQQWPNADALVSFHCDTMGPEGTLGLWRKDIDLHYAEYVHIQMIWEIYGGDEQYDRGLRQFRSYVLGALRSVPGTLLEMVQIRQEGDLERIKSASVQEAIAEAVHRGTEMFLP